MTQVFATTREGLAHPELRELLQNTDGQDFTALIPTAFGLVKALWRDSDHWTRQADCQLIAATLASWVDAAGAWSEQLQTTICTAVGRELECKPHPCTSQIKSLLPSVLLRRAQGSSAIPSLLDPLVSSLLTQGDEIRLPDADLGFAQKVELVHRAPKGATIICRNPEERRSFMTIAATERGGIPNRADLTFHVASD